MTISKTALPTLFTYVRLALIVLFLGLIHFDPVWTRATYFFGFTGGIALGYIGRYMGHSNSISRPGLVLDDTIDLALIMLPLLFVTSHSVRYNHMLITSGNGNGTVSMDETVDGYLVLLPVAMLFIGEIFARTLRSFNATPPDQGTRESIRHYVLLGATFLVTYSFWSPQGNVWQAALLALWAAVAITGYNLFEQAKTAWPKLK